MSSKQKSIAKLIAEEARRLLPRSILEAEGRALYSPASTISSGSPYYFLGLNPGESPVGVEIHDCLTVERDLDRLANNQITRHGYLDEKWGNSEPGEHKIQVAGQQVFAILAGGDLETGKNLLRITPTSNFVLRRSPSEEELKARTGEKTIDLALQCWPFHAAVLRESGCKVVITHAVGVARDFARIRQLGEGFQRPSGWGGTLSTLYAWDLPGGIRLLAIPNLSRYMPSGSREPALHAFFKEFGALL